MVVIMALLLLLLQQVVVLLLPRCRVGAAMHTARGHTGA
jgi:hypothetical protein